MVQKQVTSQKKPLELVDQRSEVEVAYSKMSQDEVMQIYNTSKQAKEFKESTYGSLMLDQLNLWVKLHDEGKMSSRLYNYEMEKEGRKVYIAAMAEEIRRDAFQTIIDTVDQDIRMGEQAEKELLKRGK